LWEQVKGIREIQELFDKYKKRNDFTNDRDDIYYPFVQDVSIKTVAWKSKELLVVRSRVSLYGPDSVVLLFIDPIIGFNKPILKILFPNKNHCCPTKIMKGWPKPPLFRSLELPHLKYKS
jgi:hypothetical protein